MGNREFPFSEFIRSYTPWLSYFISRSTNRKSTATLLDTQELINPAGPTAPVYVHHIEGTSEQTN